MLRSTALSPVLVCLLLDGGKATLAPIPDAGPVMFRGNPELRCLGRAVLLRTGRSQMESGDGGPGALLAGRHDSTIERLPAIRAAAEYGLLRK